jgi:hypothetical protein
VHRWDRDNEGNQIIPAQLEPEPERLAARLPLMSVPKLVQRCKVLYTQLSREQEDLQAGRTAAAIGRAGAGAGAAALAVAELTEVSDAVLAAAAGSPPPFALLCKGWLAINRQDLGEAAVYLEHGTYTRTSSLVSQLSRLLLTWNAARMCARRARAAARCRQGRQDRHRDGTTARNLSPPRCYCYCCRPWRRRRRHGLGADPHAEPEGKGACGGRCCGGGRSTGRAGHSGCGAKERFPAGTYSRFYHLIYCKGKTLSSFPSLCLL